MDLVNSLTDKFNKRLIAIENFYKDVPESKVTLVAISQFCEHRHADLQLSLSNLRKHQSFASLIRLGLMKGG
uniref:Uncharacterized protein n=1 Tax=Panagrolaimus davidi TaxID=227884 RepID=A0A914PP35_9BILA